MQGFSRAGTLWYALKKAVNESNGLFKNSLNISILCGSSCVGEAIVKPALEKRTLLFGFAFSMSSIVLLVFIFIAYERPQPLWEGGNEW